MKKILKKIGKGIKTGLKSIGKAFKSAFKSIGKFIGKLGPIGMIGMMLIMPQLGAWWGQFGAWAGKTAGALGKVMTGIHKAGAFVGNAYGTVTETISKTMNVVTGGTFSSAGAVGYQAGGSDQLASWMSSKLDVAREGLGLQTSGGVVPSSSTGDTSVGGEGAGATGEKFNRELPEGIERANIYEGLPSTEQAAANLQDSLGFDAMSGEEVLSTSSDLNFKPQTIEPYTEMKMNMNQPAYNPKTGAITGYQSQQEITFDADLKKFQTTGEPNFEFVPTGEGTQVPSMFDKVKKYGATAYAGTSLVKEELDKWGLLDEEGEYSSGGLGVVDGGVAMYDAAQTNWTSQGYGGEPSYGMGNPRYFESIYSYGDLLPFGRI
jgi:hypothetical protein